MNGGMEAWACVLQETPRPHWRETKRVCVVIATNMLVQSELSHVHVEGMGKEERKEEKAP